MKKIYFVFFMMVLVTCVSKTGSIAAESKQKKESGKIAFCQYDGKYWQIWTMDLDGSNKKRLTDFEVDSRSPNFSSDGRRIVYVTNDGKLWVMNSSGDNKTQISLNISAAEPKWCFQDKKIVFTSYRGVAFLDDSDIWIINSDGSGLKKVIRRPSIQFLPDVSQDGKELVFVDVLETVGHKIFKFNLETKDYVQLTENHCHDTTPVFTADTNMVVYSSDKDGNYDIWIMDKFGQNQRNLTQRPAFDSYPVISKDGKTIFFLSDSTKSMQIWSIGVDTKLVKQITMDNYDKQDISVYTS